MFRTFKSFGFYGDISNEEKEAHVLVNLHGSISPFPDKLHKHWANELGIKEEELKNSDFIYELKTPRDKDGYKIVKKQEDIWHIQTADKRYTLGSTKVVMSSHKQTADECVKIMNLYQLTLTNGL